MLKQNIHKPCWKDLFQSVSTCLSQTNYAKRLHRQDGSNLMLDDYKGPKPVVTVDATPGQGDHSAGMWSVNNFRIRHQNICSDASQLPITAACTTQLPKALWYALMNKHLWLIGKCISRVHVAVLHRSFITASWHPARRAQPTSLWIGWDVTSWCLPSSTRLNNTADYSTIFSTLCCLVFFLFLPFKKSGC